MHPADAMNLAIFLMRQHGLIGWRFRFDHAKRRFGSCVPSLKLITLSRTLTLMNPEPEVRDTLLHEIAHALEPTDGHGPRWKAACRRIGAKPARCFTDAQVVTPPRRPAACELGCPKCDQWSDRRRLMPSRYLCRYCRGPAVYREKATGRLFRILPKEGRWAIVDEPKGD